MMSYLARLALSLSRVRQVTLLSRLGLLPPSPIGEDWKAVKLGIHSQYLQSQLNSAPSVQGRWLEEKRCLVVVSILTEIAPRMAPARDG